MTAKRVSIASTGTCRHLDAAVALVSVIPFLSLALIGRVSFSGFYMSSWQWVVLIVGVICSPLLGYSLLVKYPATVMKLRVYLDEIVRGEIPDQIDLVRNETDIEAIETAMNLVLERLKSRVNQAEAVTFRLEEELLQSRKLEAVGTLAAGIAHEINTPLQFISTNLTFLENELEQGGKAAETKGFVRVPDEAMTEMATCLVESREGVHHIAGIVRAMSVFAEGGDDGIMKVIDINEAIESAVEVSRNVWKYAARCTMDLDPLLPEVTCLPGEIKQVFMNLLVNAVDAIKAKRDVTKDDTLGDICIRTRTVDDAIVITVSDSGTGVSREIRNRIFEPFFTTDATRSHQGQGLTLAYASVVERHGGDLTFESALGRGSTFRVQLPVQPVTEQKGGRV